MDIRRVAASCSRAAIRTRLRAAGTAVLAVLALAAAAGAAPANSPPAGAWVRVSYRDVLDPEVLTHSGVRLADAMRRKTLRGDVQPFLEPYSALLGFAVQMISGADPVPQASLAERHPAGTAQPAWAAVLRGGRYFVSTDGRGRARVFAPGDAPRAAYRRAYPVLRHPLAASLPPDAPLQVEVFAYRNDFTTAELRLNPSPYRFEARAFPPQGRPLDLAALDAFFRQGGQLEGAELVPDEGLVLFASQQRRQSLGGEPVSLSDLAVAYRAVFHAGEAAPFVSLDRNVDPTLATVNFGGLLEDTRIGVAVLAADVRFKTMSSGLDPVTGADIREATRRAVPSFMTNSERWFLADPQKDRERWVIARYWFYPDSCGVVSDEKSRLAAITSAQLTADVERIGTDTVATTSRKKPLPAPFRENIRDLNENFDRYAAVFPEYRDLSAAARLMAIAAWLGRVRPDWLDLDGLLAVTLPAAATPRAVTQLLSAETLQLPESGPPGRDYVLRNTQVRLLTPALDESVAEHFGTARRLAAFLALQAGKGRASEFTAQAERLFPAVRDKPVRVLLKSVADLQAFLQSAASRLLVEMAGARPAESDRDRRRLDEILAALAAPPAGAATGTADGPQRALLEQELQELKRRYHAHGAAAKPSVTFTTQYTGGVSLAPRLFSVKKAAASPALDKIRAASRAAASPGSTAGWMRSGTRREPAAAGSREPKATLRPSRPAPVGANPPQPAAAETSGPTAPPLPTGKPAMRSIAVPGTATPAGSPVVGNLEAGGRIVFTRTAR